MADIFDEHLVPVGRVKSPRGGYVSLATIYRWKDNGLETVMFGGLRYTSDEALRRYHLERTARAEDRPKNGTSAAPVARRTPAQRQRDSERAERELQRRGA